jgi:hypothetical protein
MATNPKMSSIHTYRHYLQLSSCQRVTKQGTVGLEECSAIAIFPFSLQRPTLRVASLQLLQHMPIHVISSLPTNLWLSTKAVAWRGQWSGLVVQVKQSLYRPGQALRVPGSWGSQMNLVRMSALRTGRLFSQDIYLVLISLIGWVYPRATVQQEVLSRWKIPMSPSGIEPPTFRFVVPPRARQGWW